MIIFVNQEGTLRMSCVPDQEELLILKHRSAFLPFPLSKTFADPESCRYLPTSEENVRSGEWKKTIDILVSCSFQTVRVGGLFINSPYGA
ncbi:hypothetical protein LENED_007730 [Lentinula edodes]|uniref:Uncharacterized protein n=1 Tax=Lentinula edodes TaxID=5353 RepID=A0A1Q3EF50_LENED|nr:hypothetical protein LENED_007730 [Lentinula edodes]